MAWEITPIQKRDNRTKVFLALGVALGVMVLNSALFVALLNRDADGFYLLAITTVGTMAAFLVIPFIYVRALAKKRRRIIGAEHNVELSDSYLVEMTLLVQEEPVGKDTGFIVLRKGAVAFVGLRATFALPTQGMTAVPTTSRVRIATDVLPDETIELRPTGTILRRHVHSQRICEFVADHSREAPPRNWKSVLPPAGIDPALEVTQVKIDKHRQLKWVGISLSAAGVLGVVLGVAFKIDALEKGLVHLIVAGVTGLVTMNSTIKGERSRFVVHEAIRQGSLGRREPLPERGSGS